MTMQCTIIFFFKGTKTRANSRPGETYAYEDKHEDQPHVWPQLLCNHTWGQTCGHRCGLLLMCVFMCGFFTHMRTQPSWRASTRALVESCPNHASCDFCLWPSVGSPALYSYGRGLSLQCQWPICIVRIWSFWVSFFCCGVAVMTNLLLVGSIVD